EHYHDKHGVIINTGTDDGFQTTGYSVNMDYRLNQRMVWRNELRKLTSRDAIFDKDGVRSIDNNVMAATALTLSF
ncbi:MAG: outer membrane beta-barrel protein, partial [Methylophilus sp.]